MKEGIGAYHQQRDDGASPLRLEKELWFFRFFEREREEWGIILYATLFIDFF